MEIFSTSLNFSSWLRFIPFMVSLKSWSFQYQYTKSSPLFYLSCTKLVTAWIFLVAIMWSILITTGDDFHTLCLKVHYINSLICASFFLGYFFLKSETEWLLREEEVFEAYGLGKFLWHYMYRYSDFTVPPSLHQVGFLLGGYVKPSSCMLYMLIHF